LIRLPVNKGARDKHSRRNNNFYLYSLNLHNKNKLIPTKTCTSSKRVEIQNRGEKEMAQTKLGGGRTGWTWEEGRFNLPPPTPRSFPLFKSAVQYMVILAMLTRLDKKKH